MCDTHNWMYYVGFSFSMTIPPVDVYLCQTYVGVSKQCWNEKHFAHGRTVFIEKTFKNSIKFAKNKSGLLLN